MKRSKSTGQFLKIEDGKKTKKMLEVEKALGRSLELDFQEYYHKRNWGQKKIASRWNVSRSQIFRDYKESDKRRSWAQMLKLDVRRINDSDAKDNNKSTKGCELCNVSNIPLDNAHWIARRVRGTTKRNNILELCPNCHRKLDRGEDKDFIHHAKITILYREAKKIIESGKIETNIKEELFKTCKQILERKE